MTMRITGLASGLDTESMITELTKVQSQKVDNLKGEQKKLQWTQDKWKETNTKIVSFYKGSLNDMRFDAAFNKKSTTTTNEDAVEVLTGDKAMIATQTMSVDALATSGYTTGGKVQRADGTAAAINGKSTLKDLGLDTTSLNGAASKMTIHFGGANSDDTMEIEVKPSDSINEFLAKLNNGKSKNGHTLSANFDEKTGRFYIASAKTGKDASFTIEAQSADGGTNIDLDKLGLGSSATHTDGSDAQITLNGTQYTSDSNTFEINGLTLTAKQKASDILIQTKNDTSGIYDKIKGFLKDYNELIKSFDTMYNAEDAKEYDMLTDEEENEMSDSKVEDWNKKIKDSLLRRDSTLGTLSTSFKTAMMQSFSITDKDGNTTDVSLSTFGIKTLNYFDAKDNERGMYHIDGDADDAESKDKTDKLKAAIASDPDKVGEFFKQLSKGLYDKLTGLMSKTEFSSSFTVYEDVRMKKQYSDYTTQISDAEKELEDTEDKYYDQFGQMEKAMSQLNSQQSQMSGMFA